MAGWAFLTGRMQDIRFLASKIRDKREWNRDLKNTTAGYGICQKTGAGWQDEGTLLCNLYHNEIASKNGKLSQEE